MCTELQDFDLRVRGAVQVAEEWAAKNETPVWALSDIISIYNELMAQSFALFERYCQSGELPGNLKFFELIEKLRTLTLRARSLLRNNTSEVASELQANVDRAQAILDEDSFATDMAMLNLAEEE